MSDQGHYDGGQERTRRLQLSESVSDDIRHLLEGFTNSLDRDTRGFETDSKFGAGVARVRKLVQEGLEAFLVGNDQPLIDLYRRCQEKKGDHVWGYDIVGWLNAEEFRKILVKLGITI